MTNTAHLTTLIWNSYFWPFFKNEINLDKKEKKKKHVNNNNYINIYQLIEA